MTTADLKKYKVLGMREEYGDLWQDKLNDLIVELVMYTVYIAITCFFAIIGKSYIFSFLGENVTMSVR